jgi:CHAD domain-containing protein
LKARKVKALDPDGPLDANLRRIVAVRLAEVRSFGKAVLDPNAVEALHDMRIAAKRVRYVLELGEPVLGPEAGRGAKRARALQDVLGEIHDCDEGIPRVLELIDRLREEDVAAMTGSADPEASDLDPATLRSARNRRKYPGLESLVSYMRARRAVLYAEFLRDWAKFERAGIGASLDGAGH